MPKKERITLDMVMSNEPYEVKVPPYGTVLVRDPTLKDRREARKEAKEGEYWESMEPDEREMDILQRLGLKMLIEPKITVEQYLENPEAKILTILDTIIMEYGKRVKDLTEKRAKVVKDFLEQMRGKKAKSTFIS